MVQVVKFFYQFQVCHLKKNFSHLVAQSTLFKNYLQKYEFNYKNRNVVYKRNICELLKTIPKSLTPKNLMIIKQNFRHLSGQ